MDGSWRQATRSISWTELGLAMVITGVILFAIAVSVGTVVGMATSGAMVFGGLLAIGCATTHAALPGDRPADGPGSA